MAEIAAYRSVIASRLRAQRSYRLSFGLDLAGTLLIGLTELGEVWVIFHNVTVLGGLELPAVLVMFGLSNAAFALADMVVGHVDRLPTYIRAGTLDVLFLRPQPVLAQLMTADFQVRRLSRVAVGLVALLVGLVQSGVQWSPARVLVLALALVCGPLLFGAVFVTAAGVQFFVLNGAELTNSFTYGGAYAAAQPASVFPRPLRAFFGFLVPVAFTGYLPTLALLGLPGPALLPAWLVWCTPLAVGWAWLLAGLTWRLGARHYQGAGG